MVSALVCLALWDWGFWCLENGVSGFRVLVFRVLGFGVLGFRVLGFRGVGQVFLDQWAPKVG